MVFFEHDIKGFTVFVALLKLTRDGFVLKRKSMLHTTNLILFLLKIVVFPGFVNVFVTLKTDVF